MCALFPTPQYHLIHNDGSIVSYLEGEISGRNGRELFVCGKLYIMYQTVFPRPECIQYSSYHVGKWDIWIILFEKNSLFCDEAHLAPPVFEGIEEL